MDTDFVSEYTLNAVGVRKATLHEAKNLMFPGHWDSLLMEWIEQDKILITSDGSLFITDVAGLTRAQETLTKHPYAWEDLLEIIEDNSFQAESYNVGTAVALLAAGWQPTTKG